MTGIIALFRSGIGWLSQILPWLLVRESVPSNTRERFSAHATDDVNLVVNPHRQTHRPRCLGDLLDDLETVYSACALPDSKFSWLSRAHMKALRIIGPYVPYDPLFRSDGISVSEEDTKMDAALTRANTVCIATGHEVVEMERQGHDMALPRVFFAIKMARLDAHCTQHPGVPYLVGFGYELGSSPTATTMTHLHWVCLVVAIDGDGTIRFCDELKSEQHQISVRNARDRRRCGPVRTISRMSWQPPSLLAMNRSFHSETKDRMENFYRALIVKGFRWWSGRDRHWQVSVRKRKSRITFSVEPIHTKYYFADRDKTVVTPSGQRKRIIHLVRRHDRVLRNGSVTTVKEHLRGLRFFNWHGFECGVNAPKFHNPIVTSLFDVSPIDVGDIAPIDRRKYLDAAQVACALVDVEDA